MHFLVYPCTKIAVMPAAKPIGHFGNQGKEHSLFDYQKMTGRLIV
jgi:hypothetical protein